MLFTLKSEMANWPLSYKWKWLGQAYLLQTSCSRNLNWQGITVTTQLLTWPLAKLSSITMTASLVSEVSLLDATFIRTPVCFCSSFTYQKQKYYVRHQSKITPLKASGCNPKCCLHLSSVLQTAIIQSNTCTKIPSLQVNTNLMID